MGGMGGGGWRDKDVHCNVPIHGFSRDGEGVGRPKGIGESQFPRPTPGHIVHTKVSMLQLNLPPRGPFQMAKFLLW